MGWSTRHSVSRRQFLGNACVFLAAGIVAHRGMASVMDQEEDERLCGLRFSMARDKDLASRSIGDVIVAIGSSFNGTPYQAHTLEAPGDEQLVVNLRRLDCVTFVESTLALSRCVKMGRTTFEDFQDQLRFVRYRGGTIAGYASRLHYFSDWIQDNERKGIVRSISRDLGGRDAGKTIHFMSSHRSSYPALVNDELFRRVKEIENQLNAMEHYFISRDRFDAVQDAIRDGDIIAITTSIEGLDVSHTGLAVRRDGTLTFLHAPLSKGVVQITKESLVQYVRARPKNTGVMIARPLEPEVVK